VKETTYKCDACNEPVEKGRYFNMVDGHCVFLLKNINDSMHEHHSLNLKLKTVSGKNLEREFCYNCLMEMIENAHLEHIGKKS